MKNIRIIALILALLLTFSGCRKTNMPQPTETRPTPTVGTTEPVAPSIVDPTLDTNIPDPTVNSNSQGMDETTIDNTETGSNGEQDAENTDTSINGSNQRSEK